MNQYIEFNIRALVVWGRARYLSVTEASPNTESLRVSGGKTFFEIRMPERETNPRSQTFQAAFTTAPGPRPNPTETHRLQYNFILLVIDQCFYNYYIKNIKQN